MVHKSGIILIDKQQGETSFEVVRKVKRICMARKVGHTGTLDKFATGLLIICVNKATAFQKLFMSHDKTYRAVIHFGMETDTLDPYGRVIKINPQDSFDSETIKQILFKFHGTIKQVPPLFSALKRNGIPLYKKALKGEAFKINPREVVIRYLTLLKNKGKQIEIEAKVSKGTYIRALARDLAYALGTYGYCERLRRLSIGPFSVESATTVDRLDCRNVVPLEEALGYIPSIEVDGGLANRIFNGVPLENLFSENERKSFEKGYLRILHNGVLIAVAVNNEGLRYFKVIRG